ncbi:hypothetical protein LTR86_008773 [Recurvomyces mirabilis]|nr:hypothetical protein LTR86_008773 [Recurvomyces mirabilis]
MSYAAFDEPLAYSPWNESNDKEEHEQNTPAKPLSGPGTSRQTRRLQLRNAGFRGSAVPTRKVTPKSVSSSSMAWSAASGIISGSDAENVSPMGVKAGSMKVDKRRSSGVLQEIDLGSNTLTRPKSARPRITSQNLFAPVTSDRRDVAAYQDDPMSPPPQPKSTIQAKSMRARAKMNKTRRSVSGEARMYIDHLENELAQTQEQLRVVNSPTVTRQQSSKMRTLNAETRHLQEELAEWEARYDQRVQEIVDEHTEIETGLRKQVRKLEQDAEESRYRLQELEIEVDAVRIAAETAEAANVNLERRLEIMSEILATSPTKIELHSIIPGMHKKKQHQRPKSMLPRFPTASSLHMSPERPPRTQPASPLIPFTEAPTTFFPEPFEPPLTSESDIPSDAESIFSGPPTSLNNGGGGDGGSTTSLEPQQPVDPFNPWTTQAAKTRPARRMRRFGPGSHGPKPLILPSTSQFYEPAFSAPALERSETAPVFAFPVYEREVGMGMGMGILGEGRMGEDESPSSLLVRRRASTTADQRTFDHLAASPFSFSSSSSRPPSSSSRMMVDESLLGIQCPASEQAEQRTPRDFSSLGSVAGRNLMDELCAVGTNEMSEEGNGEVVRVDEDGDGAGDGTGDEEGEESTKLDVSMGGDTSEERLLASGPEYGEESDDHSLLTAETTTLIAAASPTEHHSTAMPNKPHHSTFHRLRLLFSDLWNSPVALARHLVQTASSRLRIPSPLREAQWWLVGMLLGPMAKRHLSRLDRTKGLGVACRSCVNGEVERQQQQRGLLEGHDVGGDGGMGYGTFYRTPPVSPSLSAKDMTAAVETRLLHLANTPPIPDQQGQQQVQERPGPGTPPGYG